MADRSGELRAGRVGRPHGLDGSFYVTRPLSRLLGLGMSVTVAGRSVAIVRRAGTDSRPIVRVEGVEDRGAAEALRGAEVTVPAQEAPALAEGEWWAHELQGCALLDGVTRDLNVMVRHARARSLVTAASFLDEAEPGTSPGFGFFALQPLALHGAGALPVEMPALSLAWCESPFDASHAWSVQPLHAGQEHTLPGYWIRLLPHAR